MTKVATPSTMRVGELVRLLREFDQRQTIVVGSAEGTSLGAAHVGPIDPGQGPFRGPLMIYSYPVGYEPEPGDCDCLLCYVRAGGEL